MIKYVIIIAIIILFLTLLLYLYQKDERFYNYNDVYPELEILKENKDVIKKEVDNVIAEKWVDWPETYLYADNMNWKIFPFYAFGTSFDKNKELCPELSKILDNIPNLRSAIISRLGPETKLEPHQGWGFHSNKVLRCHYGINVPDECYIVVEGEKSQHKNNEIIVFDDSKEHYAENFSKQDRIILLIDIDRPWYIRRGKSKIQESDELSNLVKNYKNSTI